MGTSRGSKLPARSSGVSSPIAPTSVASVLGVLPLREFGLPRPAGSPRLVAQMLGQFGLQAAFEHRLDYLREETALPGQRQLAGIDAVHDSSNSPASSICLTAWRADGGSDVAVTPSGCACSVAMSP